jgi:hypothetical protein
VRHDFAGACQPHVLDEVVALSGADVTCCAMSCGSAMVPLRLVLVVALLYGIESFFAILFIFHNVRGLRVMDRDNSYST